MASTPVRSATSRAAIRPATGRVSPSKHHSSVRPATAATPGRHTSRPATALYSPSARPATAQPATAQPYSSRRLTASSSMFLSASLTSSPSSREAATVICPARMAAARSGAETSRLCLCARHNMPTIPLDVLDEFLHAVSRFLSGCCIYNLIYGLRYSICCVFIYIILPHFRCGHNYAALAHTEGWPVSACACLCRHSRCRK